MPYSIAKRSGDCGSSKPWAVINTETDKTVKGGCHATHGEALKHQRALTLNVKADETAPVPEEVIAALVDATIEPYLAFKPAAQLTQRERMRLAKAGLARPDGSYPIRNIAELKDAIKAYGRSNPSERASVKAWIERRARALGAQRVLPANWG